MIIKTLNFFFKLANIDKKFFFILFDGGVNHNHAIKDNVLI